MIDEDDVKACTIFALLVGNNTDILLLQDALLEYPPGSVEYGIILDRVRQLELIRYE